MLQSAEPVNVESRTAHRELFCLIEILDEVVVAGATHAISLLPSARLCC